MRSVAVDLQLFASQAERFASAAVAPLQNALPATQRLPAG
jgi:hypothetical protein